MKRDHRLRNLDPKIASCAMMRHKTHGEHLVDTMKRGVTIGVTPMETAAVDPLRVKGAGEYAALLSLDRGEFGTAYLTPWSRLTPK